jgi:gamma-glutamylcyclotransferase (GGCT)/AIG2-like uncharacterized protein YtfP
MECDPYLFVYGTLRKTANQPTHRVLAQHATFVSMATFQGRLYDLGRYPAAKPSARSNDRVVGELYELQDPDMALPIIDEYEGRAFKRDRVTVVLPDGETVPCWMYLYARPIAGRPLILSGDYVKYLSDP